MRSLWRAGICALMLACVLYAPVFSAAAEATLSTDVQVRVNDRLLACYPAPCIVNGTAYVPLRVFSEAFFSCQVLWDNDLRTAFVLADGITLYLTEGVQSLTVNGRTLPMAGAAFLSAGKTMVPVRALADAYGAHITWENGTRTVQVKHTEEYAFAEESIAAAGTNAGTYSEDDLFWLARIIYAESGGEPLEGQIAVGNVVLNRVASPSYPDTIVGVIFDSRNGIQFEPVANGTIFNTPSAQSYTAARMALEGTDIVGSCQYFFNPSLSPGTWIVTNRTYVTTIGSHVFYA